MVCFTISKQDLIFTVVPYVQTKLMAKKLLIWLIWSLLCLSKSWAQQVNLVRNGSFEDTIFCPPNANIMAAQYWTAGVPGGVSSTDYFHSCAGTVPVFLNNWVQSAADGQAYIAAGNGVGNYDTLAPSLREFASGQLSRCLKANKKYRFSFYVSPPAHQQSARLGYDCFEVVFHPDTFALDGQNDGVSRRYFELSSQAMAMPVQGPILQRGVWHRLEMEFTAHGNACFFTVGCFKRLQAENMDTLVGPGAVGFVFTSVYYLYDRFELVALEDESEPAEPVLPNVFTPNGDGLNDFWEIKNLPPATRVRIHNRWGQQVYASEQYDNRWDAAGLSGGTYLVEVLFNDWPARRLAVFVVK